LLQGKGDLEEVFMEVVGEREPSFSSHWTA